jgi:hypothetical protein
MRLSDGIKQNLDKFASNDEEISLLMYQSKVENIWKCALEKYLRRGADAALKSTNAVCRMKKNDGMHLIVYMDDSTARSNVLLKEGFIKKFFRDVGLEYSIFELLPSRRSMKSRHPFVSVQKETSDNSPHERELSDDERREIINSAKELSDTALKKAFIEAFAATLKYDN